MTAARGIRNDFMSRTQDDSLPRDDTHTEHHDGWQPAGRGRAGATAPAHARSCQALGPDARLGRRRPPSSVRCGAGPRGPGSRAGSSAAVSRVSTVRGWGRSTSTTRAIRPGRGDITTTRVERNTASGMEWVTNTMVVAGAPPDLHQLEVHPLARHLVERPERLVHQQQLRVEGERAGDRDPLLHPA